MTSPSFLAKIAQILQKVIAFFPKRGEEIEPWFSHIWIAQWLKFFRTPTYFFISAIISWKREVKNGQKELTLGPSFLHKNSNLLTTFQTMFLFERVLPLVRISAILDYIWGSKGPKTSQKESFCWCWIGTQNFENV